MKKIFKNDSQISKFLKIISKILYLTNTLDSKTDIEDFNINLLSLD